MRKTHAETECVNAHLESVSKSVLHEDKMIYHSYQRIFYIIKWRVSRIQNIPQKNIFQHKIIFGKQNKWLCT